MKKWHGALAASIALIALGCGSGASDTDAKKNALPAATTEDSSATKTTEPAEPVETTTPPAVAPKPSDFKLAVKVTKKECFGSAGCNITFHVNVTLTAVTDPDADWLVTYEVKGGDDPLINSFTLHGTKYDQEEEFIQVPRSSSKLTAKVTEVAEG